VFVNEVPGYSPKSPPMVVGPVLVTVEPPRTAKLPAVPRIGSANASGAVVHLEKTQRRRTEEERAGSLHKIHVAIVGVIAIL